MSNKKNTNKSIFVSSTFRDMQAERDALRNFVLPKVNEFAAQYGRAVEIIDLRWGVDTSTVSEEEQNKKEIEQNKKVLRTCLNEIKRCSFFLGLIGDRYGFTPPKKAMTDALQEVAYDASTEQSVTALEIEYGALRTEKPPICLFYFRESPDYAAISEKMRAVYQDDVQGLAKLEKLKEEISVKYADDIKHYAADVQEDGLAVSKEWAAMVATDIIAKLRLEWGEIPVAPPDWKTQESETQATFRESRTEHFAGRAEAVKNLAEFCLGEDSSPPLLMLQGAAGSGKSGLLCKVMDEIEGDCLLLPFSCGLSSRSSLVENMLRYFISLLCRELKLDDDSDELTKFDDWKERFNELLLAATKKKRVVAVVDALDQLYGSDEARRMLWISGRLPENFRLLCSLIDGEEAEAVKRLGGEIQAMPEISQKDVKELIRALAARHCKQLSDEVIDYILQTQARAAQNPLYLSLIVQNLVMMDRYEFDVVQQGMNSGQSHAEALTAFMRKRIDDTPGEPEGAYLAIMGRLEDILEREYIGGGEFVRAVCGMIAASRSGLRESDIEGAFKKLGMSFNSADFSWLRQMLTGHVSQGDEQQWDFSHQCLRRALRNERHEEHICLNESIAETMYEDIFSTMNDGIQDYFVVREVMNHLCFANLPYAAAVLLIECNDKWDALIQGVADLITAYGEGGQIYILLILSAAKCENHIERYALSEAFRYKLLPLLNDSTTYSFRITLMEMATSILCGLEDRESKSVMAACNNTLAHLYYKIGDSDKAKELYEKALFAREELFSAFPDILTISNLSSSYESLYDFLLENGDTKEAGKYCNLTLELRQFAYDKTGEISDLRGLAFSLGRMGDFYMLEKNNGDAIDCYTKAISAFEYIYRQTETTDALSELVTPYSKIAEAFGNTKKAEKFYLKSLSAAKSAYEHIGTTASLRTYYMAYIRLGDYYIAVGEAEEAMKCFGCAFDFGKRITKCDESTNSYEELASVIVRLGDCYLHNGNKDDAIICFEEAHDILMEIYEITKSLASQRRIATVLIKIGDALTGTDRNENALRYYQNALVIREAVHEQYDTLSTLRDLSVSYARVAGAFVKMRPMQPEEAMIFMEKVIFTREQIYEACKSLPALYDLSLSYIQMGDCLQSLEHIDEVTKKKIEWLYQNALDILAHIFENEPTKRVFSDLLVMHIKIGTFFETQGSDEAYSYYKNAICILEEVNSPQDMPPELWMMQIYDNYTICGIWWDVYYKVAKFLVSQNKVKEADELFLKSLTLSLTRYDENSTCEALGAVIDSYDAAGDNKERLGFQEEARIYRVKHWNCSAYM